MTPPLPTSPSTEPPSAEAEVAAPTLAFPPPWQGVTPPKRKYEVPKQDPTTGRFLAGHKGRPTGSRNKVSLAIDNLMEGEAEAITRRCIELAKAGDPTALKLVMDRVCPPRKGRALPKLDKQDGEGTVNRLLRAVLEGEITPEEGKSLVDLIESAARVAAVQALGEARQQQLEAFKRAQERGLTPGVMLVPLADSVEEWESAASARQADLKQRVKE